MSRSIAVFLLVVPFLLLLAAPAFARAPTLAELPTVKSVLDKADAAKTAIAKKKEEDEKDPKMEDIQKYQEGRESLFHWKRVVDILKSDKQAKYREASAEALRQRFKDLPPRDVAVMKVKKEIGTALLSMLKARDKTDRNLVASVYRVFWPGEYARIGYDPNEVAYRALVRKTKEWERFLKR